MDLLRRRGVGEPEASAEHILASLLKSSRPEVRLHSDRSVPASLAKKYLSLVRRRSRGWPVAYV
ncbi:MAG: hypothetical protein HY400_05965, partial [Elusimicrobia bacterium]|nr:hypothetical protein [Elusimicrobiota bacterium]